MFGLRRARISQIAFAPAREIITSAAAIRSHNSSLIYSYCTYPFVPFKDSSSLPLPQRWMIWNFSNSFGRILRTAVLTATAPRLPPMIRSVGFSSVNPQKASPFSLSPWKSSSRIGEPVRTAFCGGRCLIVSGKFVQTRFAQGIQILFASPGVISDSWITQGIFLDLAASTTGTDTKPPLEKTTSGLIFFSNLRA